MTSTIAWRITGNPDIDISLNAGLLFNDTLCEYPHAITGDAAGHCL
jgi:hypothetical protein